MLKGDYELANKIIVFYGDRGIDCSVVDEHTAMLVTLSADGRSHAFRCGLRSLSKPRGWGRVRRLLEWEISRLMSSPPDPGVLPRGRDRSVGGEEC